MRKLHVSSEHSVDRLRLAHGDELLLMECTSADLPRAKLLQASILCLLHREINAVLQIIVIDLFS